MAIIPPPSTIEPSIYEGLFKDLQASILFIDGQTGTILDANPAACAFYGYSHTELIHKTVFDISALTPEETRERMSRIAAGEITHMHTRHRLANGEIRDVDVALGRHSSGERMINIAVINDITAQVQSQVAARESEAQFSSLFHISPVGINIFSTITGRSVDCNDAFLELTGYTRDELLYHTATELNLFATPEERLGWMQTLRQEGVLKNIPTVLRKKSGELQHVMASMASFEVKGETLVILTAIDIIERKHAETALWAAHDELERRVDERTMELQESQQWLKTAIQAAKIGLWDWDLKTNQVIYSPEYKRMLGYEDHEFPNEFASWASHVHPEDREIAHAKTTAFIQRPYDGYWNEFRMRHKDGVYRWMLAQASVIHDDQGKPIRMLGSHIDVTERKYAETEMQLRNQLLALSYEPIFTWELEKGIQLWNEGCQKLYGFSQEESFGRSPHELLATIHPTALENVIDQLERTGHWEGELQHRTKDGRLVIVESHQILSGLGEQRLVLESNRDITQRKQSEQILIETNITLEKAIRVKDEFMAAMGHELRTPLTGILGMAEAVQMPHYGELTEKQRKAIGVIETSGQRLLTVLNDILDYSKLQSGEIKTYPKPCNLTEICRSALHAIEPSIVEKHQHTQFTIEPESIIITTDQLLLLKLLDYLLDNASKFTPAAGEFGLDVSGNRDQKQVNISIWDKGIGIQEPDLPLLFQPFVQLDATLARQYEGTGLGLALVKQITELLGGSVSVQSLFGTGSRFTVTLPWLNNPFDAEWAKQ